MTRHYSTKDFFRQMPNALLGLYFRGQGLFDDIDFAAMKEGKPDELFAAWLLLPDNQRNPMDAEFRDIFEMSCDTATFADWGLLLLRSQFSDRLDLRSQTNLSLTAAQREALSNGHGFLGPVLQNPQDQLVPSFDEQQPVKSCARLGFETASLLLSPITVEGQLLGLIVLGGNESDQFDLNALNLVRGVARQAAQAILNARHREEEQARTRHSRQFVRF